MWVKNQDGIAVVSVDALALDPAEILKKDVKNVRIWGSIADNDFVMGVYDSVEDAKAVCNSCHDRFVGNVGYYKTAVKM